MVSLKSNLQKHQLSLSFLLVILVFVVFGYISFKEVQQLGGTAKKIFSHPLVVSNAALNTDLNIIQMHRSMKDVAISKNTLDLELALASVNKSEDEAYRHLDTIQKNILGMEGQQLERETRELLDDWKPIRAKVIALTREKKTEEAAKITKMEGALHVDKLELQMKTLNIYARNKAIGFMNEAVKTQERLENLSLLMTLIGILLCGIIATITIKRETKAENDLKEERDKLQEALDEIKTLQGIIPICSYCKHIRDDKGMWNQIEEYIHNHSDAQLSHGICPSCMIENFPEQAEELLGNKKS